MVVNYSQSKTLFLLSENMVFQAISPFLCMVKSVICDRCLYEKECNIMEASMKALIRKGGRMSTVNRLWGLFQKEKQKYPHLVVSYHAQDIQNPFFTYRNAKNQGILVRFKPNGMIRDAAYKENIFSADAGIDVKSKNQNRSPTEFFTLITDIEKQLQKEKNQSVER